MLTAVSRDQRWPDVVAGISARFSKFAFVLFCYKTNHLMTGPWNLNVSLDFVSENIEILGKQNSLLPSGLVIKCLLFPLGEVIECLMQWSCKFNNFPAVRIDPLKDPDTWYRINYAGTQITQWDFQNKGKSGWTGKISFVVKVLLRHLRPSIIYSVPRDWIVQRAYFFFFNCTTCNTSYLHHLQY